MTPALASIGFSSDVESISSIPSSFNTDATAPMSPSVLRNGSFMSTDRNFASGTMPPAKIFVCFTWPAMTAWLAPAFFSRRDALAQLAERDPVNLRARFGGRLVQIGERLLPWWR